MKTEAVLFTGINRVEIGEVELPGPGPTEVLVQASYTCISPGTDLRVLAGMEPSASKWPLIPGYSMVGKVVARGSGVTDLENGTRVFCKGTQRCSHHTSWGAHMAHAVVAANAVHRIPDTVDDVQASLAKLAAISYHGMTRTQPRSDDNVAVVGLGPIGMLAAVFHQLSGARVVCADLVPSRLELASNLGLEVVPAAASLKESFATVIPNGADIVVDSTGSPVVLDQCVDLARELSWDGGWEYGSKLLIQGSYSDLFSINYQKAFVRELRILLTRDHHSEDLDKVLELMGQGRVNLRSIISDVYEYRDADKAFANLRLPKGESMTIALKWN